MSPPPGPSYSEGSNGVFRSVGSSDTLSPYETLPGIDSRSDQLTLGQGSQDASLSEGLQWAVTPKLTMIAGRQLSIEGASGTKLPSRFNSNMGKTDSNRRAAVYGCK